MDSFWNASFAGLYPFFARLTAFHFGIHLAKQFDEVVSNTDLFEKGRLITMAEENSTGSNFIWAVAMIIIVAMIAGAVYYSGMLSGTKKQDVDIEVKVPSSSQSR